MVDLFRDENICYEYFKNNDITNRESLRSNLKTNPLKNINYSFIEAMFSNYQKENKRKKKEEIIKDITKVVCINDIYPYKIIMHVNYVLELWN